MIQHFKRQIYRLVRIGCQVYHIQMTIATVLKIFNPDRIKPFLQWNNIGPVIFAPVQPIVIDDFLVIDKKPRSVAGRKCEYIIAIHLYFKITFEYTAEIRLYGKVLQAERTISNTGINCF